LPNVKDTKAKADLEALKARYEEYGKQLEAEMAKRSNAKSKPES
jgi:hypothetical protein